jgi:hypothetical protein
LLLLNLLILLYDISETIHRLLLIICFIILTRLDLAVSQRFYIRVVKELFFRLVQFNELEVYNIIKLNSWVLFCHTKRLLVIFYQLPKFLVGKHHIIVPDENDRLAHLVEYGVMNFLLLFHHLITPIG